VKSLGAKFIAITPKLLSGFIAQSEHLGGTLLDQFWSTVERCHPKLAENGASRSFLWRHYPHTGITVQNLRLTEPSSSISAEALLFEGIERKTVDFDPIFKMAAELFTHLGVASMYLPFV
jgi:hypothetical protein